MREASIVLLVLDPSWNFYTVYKIAVHDRSAYLSVAFQ